MPLPDKRDHKITITEAADLTRRHRKDNPQTEHGGFFHREAFETLLRQPECAGIRVYHGKAEDGSSHLVLVAVDKGGADLVGGDTMDLMFPCPPYCDLTSPLRT